MPALALLAALALGAPAQDPAANAERRFDLDYRAFHGPEAIDEAMKALAEAYPLALKLVEIGRSRQGRPIHVAVVGEGELEAVLARPALFAGDALLGPDLAAGEALLYALDALVANRRRDQALARTLAERTLVLAPCLDPDARAEQLGEGRPPRSVSYDANFPIGWLPSRLGHQAGPFPLSEPESEAIARFLVGEPAIAASLVFSARPAAAQPSEPRDPASQARLLAAAQRARAGDLSLATAESLERRAGGLLEFSAELCGHLAFGATVPRAVTSPEEVPALGAQLSRALTALAAELPALELRELGRERLGPERWRIDLAVANRGGVATASALGTARFGVGGLRLSSTGGTLVAAIERRAGTPGSQLTGFGTNELDLTALASGEERQLSLFFDAPAGTLVHMELTGTRAGRAMLESSLQ